MRCDQHVLERSEGPIVTEERLEQRVGALGRQGIDPQLEIVGLATPGVRELGPVVDEEQDASCGQAVDEAVEERLGLGVDPVKILEDHEQRLDLALAEEQPLDRLEGPLTALGADRGRPTRTSSTGTSSNARSGGAGAVRGRGPASGACR